MNTAQLTGMRLTWIESQARDRGETVTAKEMAQRKHRVSCGACVATEKNGDRWCWSEPLQAWILANWS